MMRTPEIQSAIDDKSTSFWLKDALEKALMRDPVDALNDAQKLANLLSDRLNQQIGVPAGTHIFNGPVGRVMRTNNAQIVQTFNKS
jgi:hypothetical protein